MALQSITALATITLQSASATVEFSGIPDTYRDFIVVYRGGVNGDYDTPLRFNSDLAGNYYGVNMRGDGSSATGSSNSGLGYMTFGLRNVVVPTTSYTTVYLEILDYSATDKHKTVLQRVDDATKQTLAQAWRWANSANAISSLTFSCSGGTYNSGSTFALFGRIA